MAKGTIDSIEGCGEVSWKIAETSMRCGVRCANISKEIAQPHQYPLICREDVRREIDETLGNCFNPGKNVSDEIALPFVYRLNPRPLLHAFACRESAEKGCIRVLKSLGFPSHTVSFVGSPTPRRLSILHSPFSILH